MPSSRSEIIGIAIIVVAAVVGLDAFTIKQAIFISLTAIGWAVYMRD